MREARAIRGREREMLGPPGPEPALGDLFRDLAEDSGTLIKQEIALAKMEMKETLSEATGAAMRIPVWGGMVLAGGLVLVAFLVLLVGDLLDNHWLAALLVGAVLTIWGGLMTMSAVKKLKSVTLAPETVASLRQDRMWAQSEAAGLKRDLRT